jgi:hypothetical protein
MAKREIDPALAAAASFYERLTTPDSEDWNVIVDGDRVHLSAFQEERHKDGSVVVHGRYYVMRLVEFKKTVKQLPADHNIGCVTRLQEKRRLPVLLPQQTSQAKGFQPDHYARPCGHGSGSFVYGLLVRTARHGRPIARQPHDR